MSQMLYLKRPKNGETISFILSSQSAIYMDFNLVGIKIEKVDQNLIFKFKDLASIHLYRFYDYYTPEELPFFILNCSGHLTDNFLETWNLTHKNPCFDASHDIVSWLDPRIMFF